MSEQFKPFNWLHPDVAPTRETNMIERVHDIVAGVACILELIEWSELEEASDDNVVPPLNATAKGRLQRLAITTLNQLHDDMSIEIDRINKGKK